MDKEFLLNEIKEGRAFIDKACTYEEYIEDLEDELEEARNTLAGAYEKIPEAFVRVIANDGTTINMHGPEELLETYKTRR